MSNSFNISVAPDVAAVKTVVDANSVILVDVHDTDLPGAVTKIDTNTSRLNTIINTKVPDIITEIDANETKIDTIDGLVDDIIVKLTGTPMIANLATTSTSLVTVVNVASGSGYLTGISMSGKDTNNDTWVKITIDGAVIFNDLQWIQFANVTASAEKSLSMLHRFESSLLVEVRVQSGVIITNTAVSYTLE